MPARANTADLAARLERVEAELRELRAQRSRAGRRASKLARDFSEAQATTKNEECLFDTLARDFESFAEAGSPPEAPDEALRAAVDETLSELECAEMHCWCFTRSAMTETHGECACDNCRSWRRLSSALPVGASARARGAAKDGG